MRESIKPSLPGSKHEVYTDPLPTIRPEVRLAEEEAMIWDIFALQRIHHFGNHVIRVQKTSFIHRMQYGLVIDSVKHDQLDALAGTFSLHGVIQEGDEKIPVEVIVKQGLLSGTYYCRVASDPPLKMKRYSVETI